MANEITIQTEIDGYPISFTFDYNDLEAEWTGYPNPDDLFNKLITHQKEHAERAVKALKQHGIKPPTKSSYGGYGGKRQSYDGTVELDQNKKQIRVLVDAPFINGKPDFDAKKERQKVLFSKIMSDEIDKVERTTKSGKSYQEWWYCFGFTFAQTIKDRLTAEGLTFKGAELLDQAIGAVEQVAIPDGNTPPVEDDAIKAARQRVGMKSRQLWGNDKDSDGELIADKARHKAANLVHPLAHGAKDLNHNQLDILEMVFDSLLSLRNIYDDNTSAYRVLQELSSHHFNTTSPYSLNVDNALALKSIVTREVQNTLDQEAS